MGKDVYKANLAKAEKPIKGADIVRGIYTAIDAVNQEYPREHYVIKEYNDGSKVTLAIVDKKALLHMGAKRAEVEIDPAKDYKSINYSTFGNWSFLGSGFGGVKHRDAFVCKLEDVFKQGQ